MKISNLTIGTILGLRHRQTAANDNLLIIQDKKRERMCKGKKCWPEGGETAQLVMKGHEIDKREAERVVTRTPTRVGCSKGASGSSPEVSSDAERKANPNDRLSDPVKFSSASTNCADSPDAIPRAFAPCSDSGNFGDSNHTSVSPILSCVTHHAAMQRIWDGTNARTQPHNVHNTTRDADILLSLLAGSSSGATTVWDSVAPRLARFAGHLLAVWAGFLQVFRYPTDTPYL
jgi:hypothetical protein